MAAKYDNIQVLRGIACLLVVFYHLSDVEKLFGLGQNPLKPFQWFGYAGVDLFFVLSGFIIATTTRPHLGKVRMLPAYLFRRFWRIYPVFWAAILVSVLLTSASCWPQPFPFADLSATELLDTLLLLPTVQPPRLLPVAWTLSYEVIFYLAFAALFVLPRFLAIPALAAWALAVAWATASGFAPENRFVQLVASPYILEFLIGCLAASMNWRLNAAQAAAIAILGLTWMGAGLARVAGTSSSWLALHCPERVSVFGPGMGLLVFALTGWERAGGRLRWPRLIAVGDASYSIYLLHIPVLMLSRHLSDLVGWKQTKWLHEIWILAMFSAIMFSSMLFHRRVERGLLNLSKKWMRSGAAPAAAGETALHKMAA